MTEASGQPKATVIDQSEDFVPFTIDGADLDVDLWAAYDALAKIDTHHFDDPWKCYQCGHEFQRPADDTTDTCPACGKPGTRRDEDWLDEVADYVKSVGARRCGRNAAAVFYNVITDRIDELKKKSSPTPESRTTSEASTPEPGRKDASEPGSSN